MEDISRSYEQTRHWKDPGEHSSPPRTPIETRFDLSHIVTNSASESTYGIEEKIVGGTMSRTLGRQVARQVLAAAGPGGRIICIACPLIFSSLQDIDPDGFKKHHLVDFDPQMQRFWGSNVSILEPKMWEIHYGGLWVPKNLMNKFDVIVINTTSFTDLKTNSYSECILNSLLRGSKLLAKQDKSYQAFIVAPNTSAAKLSREGFQPGGTLQQHNSFDPIRIFTHSPMRENW